MSDLLILALLALVLVGAILTVAYWIVAGQDDE